MYLHIFGFVMSVFSFFQPVQDLVAICYLERGFKESIWFGFLQLERWSVALICHEVFDEFVRVPFLVLDIEEEDIIHESFCHES